MLKRGFDLVVSALGLIILSPLLALVGLLIKMDSRGSVFFLGPRVGRGGQVFQIVKFRTMVEGSASRGPGFTVAGDPRITRIGRFLRRTKIDELPQLWNVVRGNMSLVGPRPEDPRYVALYDDQQRRLLSVRPGMTSPASIQYRNEEMLVALRGAGAYETLIMPRKIAVDLEYLRYRSFGGDLKIILKTFSEIFQPRLTQPTPDPIRGPSANNLLSDLFVAPSTGASLQGLRQNDTAQGVDPCTDGKRQP
jgi:lipopolysaccharide/colanic/teichoic acid biosynthesis glycosyltransferase